MKIERLSENQIRCTLNKDDLAARQLRISELAYGSEKARALFRDMMAQASTECNFEAEDIPLMIEAIPVSAECLILVVTKVEDPDELDTRYSSFTPYDDEDEDDEEESSAYADEILQNFEPIAKILKEHKADYPINEELFDKLDPETQAAFTSNVMTKIYAFDSLEDISGLAPVVLSFYNGLNSIYKDKNGTYYLYVSINGYSATEFNKLCNILSEYGRAERNSLARRSYLEEHCETLIKDKALQVLAQYLK